MNSDLLKAVIDVVFGGHMLYVAPFLFLIMIVLFAERMIDLIYDSIHSKRNRY